MTPAELNARLIRLLDTSSTAIKTRDAEIARLRAENDQLRRDVDWWRREAGAAANEDAAA